MAKQANFNFIQESQLSTSRPRELHTVSVSSVSGYMTFSSAYILDNNLTNKYIKLYADVNNKAIAWKTMDNCDLTDMRKYRKLSKTGKANSVQISVRAILKALNIKQGTFLKLPIQKHTNVLDGVFSYVVIK